MPITEDDVKTRILAQVGDTPKGDLAGQISLLWDAYAEKDQVAPRLRELYTTRAAIDVVLGAYQGDIDQTGGDGTMRRGNQPAVVLLKRRALVDSDIVALEKRTSAQRVGAAGLITKTAPVPFPPMPNTLFPDANDPRYSGSPYSPLAFPRGYLP